MKGENMGIKFGKLTELNVRIGDIVRVVGSVSEGRIENGKDWVISGVTKNRHYGRSRSGPGKVDIPLSNALIWQIVSKSKCAAIDITTMEDPETVTIGTLNAAIEAERARCVAIVTEMVELEYGGVVHANIDKAYRILTLGERVVAAIMERGQ